MSGSDCSHAADIGILGVLYAVFLTFIVGGISFYLGLQLHKDLAIAVVRCIIQLMLLGFLLVPLFDAGQVAAGLVFPYILFMTGIASLEAYARPPYKYKSMLKHIVLSFGIPCWLVLFYGIFVVIQPWTAEGADSVWYSPRYVIPVLGMILGNALDGVSLGLRNTLQELTEGRDRIDFMLALGATRWEALRPVLIDVLRMALTPLLNRLSVVGLVAIPGMMTGQILGGTSPLLAARYQIIIMFLIATSYSASTMSIAMFAMYHVVDSNHMLRLDMLHKRNETGSISKWVVKQFSTIVNNTFEFLKRVHYSCTRRPQPQPLNGFRSEGVGGRVEGVRRWWLRRGLYQQAVSNHELGNDGDKRTSELQGSIMAYSDEESLVHSEVEADAAPLLNQTSGEMQNFQIDPFSPPRS
eukprot:TRINITY_DN19249_c0_g1_i3.p1 TRINITY_DN19249_c0_g1~~TRINITY_DN19249_c0_g1_i3.p1  ORF type:complete len:411 (-),score=38.03 TRINITY_DN19249_c0_g1_i3:277-1509(-)